MAVKKKVKARKVKPKTRPTKKNTAKRKAVKRPAAKKARVQTPVRRAAAPIKPAITYPSSDNTSFWRRERYRTLQEFWPFYLHEHRYALNRRLHFIGSTLGLGIFAAAIGMGIFWLIIPAFVSGYAFAWFGHFFVEKNRPATFKYPLKSFISDWRLWYVVLTGRVYAELKKFGIESK